MINYVKLVEHKKPLNGDSLMGSNKVRLFYNKKGHKTLEVLAVLAHEEAHLEAHKLGIDDPQHKSYNEFIAWQIAERRIEAYYGEDWKKVEKHYVKVLNWGYGSHLAKEKENDKV